MTWNEAKKAMREGKRVASRQWTSRYYLFIGIDGNIIHAESDAVAPTTYCNWIDIGCGEDEEAIDWEIRS